MLARLYNEYMNQQQSDSLPFLKRHYHVVITACCFLILFLNTGLPSTSFSIYQSYLVRLDGVGDFGGSLVVTIRTLISLIAIFFVSNFYKRVSLRAGVLLASLLTTIGFFIYSFSESLEVYCLGSIFTGAGYGFGGLVAATLLIGNWYRGHVGTIVGIASMGSSFASIVIPIAVAAIIAFTALSTAFFCEAILALAVTVVLAIFLRTAPSDLGLEPTEERTNSKGTSKEKVHIGVATIDPHLRHLMLVAVFLMGASAVVGYSYFSVLLSSSGIDLALTAVLTSTLGIALTASKLSTGWIFDRIGSKAGSAILFVLIIAGLVCCSAIPLAPVFFATSAAVLFGVGSSLATTGVSIWSLELSSVEYRMRMVRNFQVAYAFGGFAFNIMPGIIAEYSGNYEINYIIFAVFMTICAILVLTVYRRRDRATSAR